MRIEGPSTAVRSWHASPYILGMLRETPIECLCGRPSISLSTWCGQCKEGHGTFYCVAYTTCGGMGEAAFRYVHARDAMNAQLQVTHTLRILPHQIIGISPVVGLHRLDEHGDRFAA